MKLSVQVDRARAILLDVEGTTTPVAFVYSTLFPYAREHTSSYLDAHRSDSEVTNLLSELASQYERDRTDGLNPRPHVAAINENRLDQVVSYIHWLIDSDRKITPLKSLQGKIWEEGYRTGQLRGEVFDDVPGAFKRWREQNRTLAIFSSGSVLAQKLLFSNTNYGDLTTFINDYFDTGIGPKIADQSYRRIAEQLQIPNREILFISDILLELRAATLAGLETVLCVRPGNQPQQPSGYPAINSFDEII
jgi:enolase-phosphatase E1